MKLGVLAAVLLALAGAVWLVNGRRVAESPKEEIAAAVQRSLPLLQRSALTWFDQRACLSCHHQSLGSMTVGLVRERGFEIDAGLQAKLMDRSVRSLPGHRTDVLQADGGINGQIGQPYRLLSLAAAGFPADRDTDARVLFLMRRQQREGSWRSESHRPPMEDSEFTATAFAVRAIQLYPLPAREPEIARRVERARAWLADAQPRNAEERAMRLFGLAWSGGAVGNLRGAREEILREQRPDGGWAQIATRASDAYATGQALVALAQAGGLETTDTAYARGVGFLLRTQLPDGTWRVATRRKTPGLEYFETGFPHGEDQFISYAATCWATSALCLTIDPRASRIWTSTAAMPRAPPAKEFDAEGITELMEAALAHDVPAVTRLIAAGAGVNAVSDEGLTALMCAAGDVDVARLLVEHGATVDARSDLDCTALMLAAGCDGATEVVRLLLDRGADVLAHDAKGETVLMRAVLTGDRDKVALLLERGAKIDATDLDGDGALSRAAWQGDAEMVRFLLEHGAPPGAEGSEALIDAIVDGQVAVVAVLLEKGARVDAAEPDGTTALMCAALVDYGDSSTLENLIAKGADVRARAKDGRTALSTALKHGHEAHAALLRKAGAQE